MIIICSVHNFSHFLWTESGADTSFRNHGFHGFRLDGEDRAMPLYISKRVEFFNGIVQFLCHSTVFLLITPPLFHPNFGSIPIGLDRRCWGQCKHVYLKLFGREIILEVFQPMWSRYLNVTDTIFYVQINWNNLYVRWLIHPIHRAYRPTAARSRRNGGYSSLRKGENKLLVVMTQCYDVGNDQICCMRRANSPPGRIMFSALFCRNSSNFEPQSAWNDRRIYSAEASAQMGQRM